IKNAPAYVNKVKFKLDEETNATYIYEIKENEVIYLNRVRPYALYLGEYQNEQDLVAAIKEDLEMMKEAHVSPHFRQYISIVQKMQGLGGQVEKLFMNVATPEGSMDHLEKILDVLAEEIERLQEFGKEMDLKTFAEKMNEGENMDDAYKEAQAAAEEKKK
ncbi:MAG: hypothetical protein ACI4W2_00250, partial [Eubacterium sp.]